MLEIMRSEDVKTYCKEQLEIICRRCSNNSICTGTGCNPRNTLEELIKLYNKVDIPEAPKPPEYETGEQINFFKGVIKI